MNRKYLIIPGYVISKSDGDRHYVSGMELIRLYGVDRDECVIVPYGWPKRRGGMSEQYINSLIHLEPRLDGDYSLPSR
jgi:hypothetical protein